MILVVDELFPDIVFEQNFRIRETIQMAHFRPWIYKQGIIADGDLTLEVLKDGEILKTVVITSSEINTEIPGTYAHGQIRFDFDTMQLNHDRKQEWTEYTVRVYMDNHTKSVDNFIGTVRRYELKFYDTYGTGVIMNEAPNDMVEPLGFEIFEWRY